MSESHWETPPTSNGERRSREFRGCGMLIGVLRLADGLLGGLSVTSKPKFHRPSKGRHISWEIYDWDCWFVTVSLGTVELQLNKWPDRSDSAIFDDED